MIKVENHYFELIEEYRECFDEAHFAKRYSDILDKYDYIVGDYGYEQLRLKGFYKDTNKKSEINRRFSTIQDYIYEYCNFGCAYFILRRLSQAEIRALTEEHVIEEDGDKLQDVKIQPTMQDVKAERQEDIDK